jgi:hypothetical protein
MPRSYPRLSVKKTGEKRKLKPRGKPFEKRNPDGRRPKGVRNKFTEDAHGLAATTLKRGLATRRARAVLRASRESDHGPRFFPRVCPCSSCRNAAWTSASGKVAATGTSSLPSATSPASSARIREFRASWLPSVLTALSN